MAHFSEMQMQLISESNRSNRKYHQTLKETPKESRQHTNTWGTIKTNTVQAQDTAKFHSSIKKKGVPIFPPPTTISPWFCIHILPLQRIPASAPQCASWSRRRSRQGGGPCTPARSCPGQPGWPHWSSWSPEPARPTRIASLPGAPAPTSSCLPCPTPLPPRTLAPHISIEMDGGYKRGQELRNNGELRGTQGGRIGGAGLVGVAAPAGPAARRTTARPRRRAGRRRRRRCQLPRRPAATSGRRPWHRIGKATVCGRRRQSKKQQQQKAEPRNHPKLPKQPANPSSSSSAGALMECGARASSERSLSESGANLSTPLPRRSGGALKRRGEGEWTGVEEEEEERHTHTHMEMVR